MREEPPGIAQQVRLALLDATAPLSVGEIYTRCDSVPDTTAVASVVNTEHAAGRLVRTGERPRYHYALTEAGRLVTQNPRLLRSRSNRRLRGRSLPPMPACPTSTEAATQSSAFTQSLPEPTAVRALLPLAPTPNEPVTATADLAARLAAAMLVHWQGTLDGMPRELRRLVDAGLSLRRAA